MQVSIRNCKYSTRETTDVLALRQPFLVALHYVCVHVYVLLREKVGVSAKTMEEKGKTYLEV